MATTSTYLTFDGLCEEAFAVYKATFGGEFTQLSRFNTIPPSEGYVVSQSDQHKILHIALPIGNTVLMGCDAGDEYGDSLVQGNNFAVSVSTNSKAEAQTIFDKLSQYGQVSQPLADTFWGAYFGAVIDQFGINWRISFDEKAAAKGAH
ncbi:VOC family protein [Mucilaginibacter sp. Mucisp86]|uniref:VOC family protein n=1 Tax=Mucilaginibacter sp. Mucisp86 TaxID=3243060 RepID=UPI0039B49B0A